MSIDLTHPKALRGYLRRLLLDYYDLSLFSILDEFGEFESRRVVLAHTGIGNVAIKLFTPQDAQSASESLIYLAEQPYPHRPVLTKSATGSYLVMSEGLGVLVYEYLPVAPVEAAGQKDWEDLGIAAGRLNQLQDCPISFKIPVDQAVDEIEAWAQTTPYAEPLRKLTGPMRSLANAQERGFIHGEINPSNAGRRENGELVLLDWDEAGTGVLALELGYPLITQFLEVGTHDFHVEEATAFYRGYFRVHPVQPDPDQIFMAALFHAVRYMRFADVKKRWERILYALEHRTTLTACLGL